MPCDPRYAYILSSSHLGEFLNANRLIRLHFLNKSVSIESFVTAPVALLYLYNVYIDFCALLLCIQVLRTCNTKISIFWMRLRWERTKLEPVMSHKTHFVYKWLLVASQNVVNNPITISKAFYRKCPEKQDF